MSDFEQAVVLRPNFAEAMSNKGATLETMGRLEEALQEYLAAVDASPDFASAHYNAARCLSRLADLERGIRHLERAIQLSPELEQEASRDDELSWILNLRRP